MREGKGIGRAAVGTRLTLRRRRQERRRLERLTAVGTEMPERMGELESVRTKEGS